MRVSVETIESVILKDNEITNVLDILFSIALILFFIAIIFILCSVILFFMSHVQDKIKTPKKEKYKIILPIEKSIQEFEDNLFHRSLKPDINEEAKSIALKTMLDEEKRQKGCIHCNLIPSRKTYCSHCGKRKEK